MDLQIENRFRWLGYSTVAGIDEAGRGALAGPVVAAAVVLPENRRAIPKGINDSKQLTREQRERLYPKICDAALAYGVGVASRAEIDEINILRAALLAMARAVEALAQNLGRHCDLLLIDGRDCCPAPVEQHCIIDGDSLSISIAAASVIAKVWRDRFMTELHRSFPLFGFNQHMGYGTEEHRLALLQFGPCSEHRVTFRGVR